MLRKKFGGPRASAAKQVVALKAGAATPTAPTASAAPEEPSTSVLPSKDIETPAAAPIVTSVAQPETPEKIHEAIPTPVIPDEPQSTRKRTDSIKEAPEEVGIIIKDQSDNVSDTESIFSPGSHHIHPRTRTFSQSSMFSTASTSTLNTNKRKKRMFEKDEDLDSSKFTMADLVDWRPKTENTLRTKWKELEKKFKDEGFTVKNEEKKEEDESAAVGPKVKIDDQGNVVIDEESLVVRNNPENAVYETVDDDLIPKKLNSLSFRKNFSRTTLWSELETELFYEVLASTGTDFSMMQEYLPFKTRADCKKKFNKEEKINMQRINETLRHPSILDDRIIKERVDRYMNLINKETERKLAEKTKSKKKSKKGAESNEVEVIEAPLPPQKDEVIDVETVEEAPEPPIAVKKPRKPRAKKVTAKTRTSPRNLEAVV